MKINYLYTLESAKELLEENGFIAEIRKVNKTQGLSYTGLNVMMPGVTSGITINLKDFVPSFVSTRKEFEMYCPDFIQTIRNKLEAMPPLTSDVIRLSADNMAYQLISLDWTDEEMLERIPYKTLGKTDLALIARVLVEQIPDGSVIVDYSLLEFAGISEEDLFGSLLKEVSEIRNPTVKPIAELIGIEEADAELPLYVASVQPDGVYGSGVVAYPGFLDTVCEIFGTGFYVLPSSIHEVLLLPDNTLPTDDSDFLFAIVRDVNRSAVEPSDRLSDNVYYYDGTVLTDAKKKRTAGTVLS